MRKQSCFIIFNITFDNTNNFLCKEFVSYSSLVFYIQRKEMIAPKNSLKHILNQIPFQIYHNTLRRCHRLQKNICKNCFWHCSSMIMNFINQSVTSCACFAKSSNTLHCKELILNEFPKHKS